MRLARAELRETESEGLRAVDEDLDRVAALRFASSPEALPETALREIADRIEMVWRSEHR